MTLEEFARRIQVLEDIEAIKRLKALYVRACDDSYNPEKIAALFVENGVWDGGKVWGLHRGRKKIKAFFAQVSSDITFAVHYIMAPDITIEGDRGYGTWYGLVPATLKGEAIWMSVRYDDEYVKIDGKWLASLMKVSVFFLTSYDKGWAKYRVMD